MCVYVCVCERESVCVYSNACVCARERESVCVCVFSLRVVIHSI